MRGESDLDHESAIVDVGLGHGGTIAADEEGVIGSRSLKGAPAPELLEEIGYGGSDVGPEIGVVGFEHGPLSPAFERGFDVQPETADGNIPPFRGRGISSLQCAGAPKEDAAVGESSQAIDRLRIEEALFGAG